MPCDFERPFVSHPAFSVIPTYYFYQQYYSLPGEWLNGTVLRLIYVPLYSTGSTRTTDDRLIRCRIDADFAVRR